MLKSVFQIKKITYLLCLFVNSALAETNITIGTDFIDTGSEQVRYLSNYSPERTWGAEQAWANISTSYALDQYTATLKGSVGTNKNTYISEASVTYNYDYTSGFSVGIRPFKQSWCRSYELTNVWITEPDVFCKFKGLSEMSESSFGVQYYKNTKFNNWAIDTQVGVYDLKVDNQSKKLGPYLEVGPTTSSKKVGIGIDAINVLDGSSYRASIMKSNLQQVSYNNKYHRALLYDSYFVGGEWPIIKNLSMRYTLSGYVGKQTDPSSLYEFNTQSKTTEITYAIGDNNKLSYGGSSYSNQTHYTYDGAKQNVSVKHQTVSLRTEWGNNWFSVVQYGVSADSSVTKSGKNAYKEGEEFAIRIGKHFSF